MPLTFLDDEPQQPTGRGLTFLDEEPQATAVSSDSSVLAAEQPPTPAAAAPVQEPAPPAGDNELYTVGRSLKRGALALDQSVSAVGLSNAAAANTDAAKAQAELDAFDQEFPAPADPIAAVEHKARRDRLVSRVAQFSGEAGTRGAQVPSLVSNIVNRERQIAATPKSAAQQEFEGEHWIRAFAKNPVEITAGLIAESAPQMLPGIAAGAMAGPGAAVIAAGSASYAGESASAMVDSMREQGVNLNDEAQVKGFFQDPAKLAKAREHAVKRGVPIALFDAATAGLGGIFLKGAEGQGVKAVLKSTGKETAMQMAGGAGGEAAGQLVAEGKITDARSIFAEALAEGPFGLIEAKSNLAGERRMQAAQGARVKAEEIRGAGLPAAAAEIEKIADEIETTPPAAAPVEEEQKAPAPETEEDLQAKANPPTREEFGRQRAAELWPQLDRARRELAQIEGKPEWESDAKELRDRIFELENELSGATISQRYSALYGDNAQKQAEAQQGEKQPIDLSRLSFVQPERSKNLDEVLVHVNVPAFDDAFKQDQGFYVAPGGEGAIPGRREGFERFLNEGRYNPQTGSYERVPIETPEVDVDERGRVAFTNGRHRFSVLRDAGITSMPMAMSPESAENARVAGLLAEPPVPAAREVTVEAAPAEDGTNGTDTTDETNGTAAAEPIAFQPGTQTTDEPQTTSAPEPEIATEPAPPASGAANPELATQPGEQAGTEGGATGAVEESPVTIHNEALGSDIEEDGFDTDPIVQTILDHGGLMSRKNAQERWSAGKWERNKGEWDDAPRMSNPRHNSIYTSNGLAPDEAAQILVEQGLLSPGSTVADLWVALGWASQSAERLRKDRAAQRRDATLRQKQHDQFQQDSNTREPGEGEFSTLDLQEGDVLLLGGEEVTVTAADADGVTLQGGDKYGRQQLDPGTIIYAKKRDADGKFKGSSAAATARSTPSGNPPSGPETPTGAPVPAGDGTTGLRNAIVDVERLRRNIPERMLPGKRSFQRVWDEATAILGRDAGAGIDLVNSLIANPRTISDTDAAVLLLEQIRRQQKFDDAMDALARATDEVERQDAQEKLRRSREELQLLYDAGQKSGTEAGRSLNIRKLLANEDFSLAKMETEMRAENGGKELSREQLAEVKKMSEELNALKKRLAEYEERENNAAAQETFAKLVSELKGEAKEAKAKGETKKGFLERQADEARKRIKARRGKLNVTLDPLNIAGLIDETIIGASHIANGLTTLAEWSAKMIAELGERIRPVLPQLFKASQEYHDANESLFNGGKKPKKVATPAEVLAKVNPEEDLDPRVVFELARAYVRQGMEGMENVMAAVHKDLEPFYEGLTVRDVRDAFSGYGKVTYPSKAEDLVKLREYKALGRLASQLEDIQSGKPPERTGPQRDKPTEAIRTLQKRVQDEMKRLGIQPTNAAQQLKSSLDAIKTRLRNEIEELTAAINRKTPRPTNNRTVVYDEEANALRVQRDAKKAEYDAIFAKPGITDEQRIKAALKSLDESIAEETKMLMEGRLKRDPRESKTPSTPEIENKRMELEALRQLRRELYAAANPGKSKAQIAYDAAMKAAKDSIARYEEMLKSGNVAPAAPAAKGYTPTSELENAWMLRDSLRDAVQELRKEGRPKKGADQKAHDAAIKALDKSIAELDRRLKTGDFSGKPRTSRTDGMNDVQAKRAERDAMRKLYDELKKASLPKRSEDEIRLQRDKKSLESRIKKLEERIAKNDYAPTPKRPPVSDQEKLDLQHKYNEARRKWNQGLFETRLKQRSLTRKVFGGIQDTLNTSRALITSVDFSGVLRQGGFIAFGRPITAAKALPDMFKAFASAKEVTRINEEIRNRPNAQSGLYDRAKLFIADERAFELRQMEEAYMSRWIEKMPWWIGGGIVRGSGRAYMAFLNRLRADSFDAMVAGLSRSGTPTTEEAKAVATFVNVATGRGELGAAAPAAVGLNTFFFAPRYVVSRFQLLMGQPLYGGTARTRTLIARQYGRYMLGVAAMYALAIGFQKATGDDDEEMELDMTSPDFLKVRFGSTRLDPMSGLLQVTTFLSREGKELAAFGAQPFTGEEREKPQYGSGDEVLWRFLRTKLSPQFGALVSAASGKDVVGKPYGPEDLGKGMVVPISFGDVLKTIEQEGVVRGSALGILSLLGVGVQTYDESEE